MPTFDVDVRQTVEAKSPRTKSAERSFISKQEASDRAIEYMQKLAAEELPKSIRDKPSCQSNCIDIGMVPKPNKCSQWNCYFAFRDPDMDRLISTYAIGITITRGVPPFSAIDIQSCLNESHGCAMAVSSKDALLYFDLESDPGSLKIIWDPALHMFFWENTQTGEQINCHEALRQ